MNIFNGSSAFPLEKKRISLHRDQLPEQGEILSSEITLTCTQGEEKARASGGIKLIRKDRVRLRSLSHAAIYHLFQSQSLRLGITRSEGGYVLNLSGEEGSTFLIEGKNFAQSIILERQENFLKLAAGNYEILGSKERIRLSLAK